MVGEQEECELCSLSDVLPTNVVRGAGFDSLLHRNAENLPRTMPETETHAAQSCTPPPRLMLVAGIQYAHFVPRATVAVVVLPALALLRLRAAVAVGGVKGGVVEEAVRVVGVQGA